MKELLATLRRGMTENVGFKLVTLLFAVVLWVWVQSQHRVDGRVQVPVTWIAPEGMAFVEPPIDRVTVEMEGVQAFVRSLPQRALSISVDLSKAEEGDVAVDLSQKKVDGLPPQLLVKGVTPTQLRLTLDRVLKRRLPVTVATVGKPAEGFRLAGVRVEPDRAEIEGAASVVRGLDGVSTAEADIGGLREDQEIEVALDLRKGLHPTRALRYTVRVDIEPVYAERRFERVPIVLATPGWLSPTPTMSVLLEGPEAELKALDEGQLSVQVSVPLGRLGATVEARRAPSEGARFEVVHGGSDALRVLEVSPPTLKLQREAPP